MKAGFSVLDITPVVGVELFGYGPFINRRSEWIREPLEARCMALESKGTTLVIASLDLGGITPECVIRAKALILKAHPELTEDSIFINCSHTHTGPGVSSLGRAWGTPDPTWEGLLPARIARAVEAALAKQEEVSLSACTVPCEGVGINRVYDNGYGVKREEGRDPAWRPAHPELTDTILTLLKFTRKDGSLAGFAVNFGAHPVVCGRSTAISGDYPEVAIHNIMRTIPGSVGVFFQGALGDVNSCLVGDREDPINAVLISLNIVAGRFESAVRNGLEKAVPVEDDTIGTVSEEITFNTKTVSPEFIRETREKEEAKFLLPDATEESCRMSAGLLDGIGMLEAFLKANPDGKRRHRLHLLRIGPAVLFGAPLEMFQAIKRDTVKGAKSQFPMIVSLADGEYGYAPDITQTSNGETYESKVSPLLCGLPSFEDVHHQLVDNFLKLEKKLFPET